MSSPRSAGRTRRRSPTRSATRTGLATIAVGVISSYDDVNSIVLAGRADLCAIGRAHLYDPNWTLHAAAAQGYAGPAAAWPDQWAAGSRPPQTGRTDGPKPRLAADPRGQGRDGRHAARPLAPARSEYRDRGTRAAEEEHRDDRAGQSAGAGQAVWLLARGRRAGGRLVFLAGQTAVDQSGAIVGRDIVEQFEQALGNLLIALRAAGGGPEHLTSLTIYATDLRDYRRARQGDRRGLAEAGRARDIRRWPRSECTDCGTKPRWSRSRASRSSRNRASSRARH